MEELKRLDEKSVAWFSKLDTQKWTQAYDLGYRYGWMTTNIAECINGVLKGARMLPITALVQLTFYRCVSYFETRRAEIRARMAVGDVYTAYAIENFRKAEAKASGHTVTIFHRIHETFEVITALHGFHMDKGRNKQVVKLNEGTCSCNKWQSFGIPCSHVLAVSAHMRIDSWQLVEKYYRLDAYASCYAPEFNPIPHESYWSYHRTMEPGPLDPIVLHGQATHRSSVAWTGVDSKELHYRRREAIFHRTSVLDGHIIPLLQQAGFYGVVHLRFISLDWHLITAFVERWRPETHTFHLPQGECTITLQDIAMLIGLPVDGDVVTGSTCLDWRRVCYSLLGLTPGDTDIDGQRLHLTWLSQSFLTLAPDADEESIQRYTRAYILQLIGGFLFSGKSSDKVHFMFLPLLEDFEVAGRFPFIAPHRLRIAPHDDQLPPPPLAIRWRDEFQTTSISMHVLAQYRHHLDRLTADQPYVDDMNVGLPDYCTAGKDIWCTISPLICFHIIEWHRPDQVLQQFGFRQGIPQPCDNESILHKCDLRGRHDVDWTTRHGDYIRRWSFRREHIARGKMAIGSLGYHDPYMVWYRSITIRFLTRTGSFHELLPTSSITRSGGVRTRGGGPHTRSSPPPHQQLISSITRSGGVRTRGGGPYTRSSPPLHQQPISPITRSRGGVWTRGRGAHTRRTRHTSVLRDAPSTDISLPPVQETPITPMEVPSTPPVVPLVASSPPSIEATLVHEELVHIANDDQQGQKTNCGRGHGRGRGRRRGRGAHGGLHVSPIEPIVEHAHHRCPLWKRKAPSCGTH
ncbi:Serine/threonine-protein phosphatase 7 long form-like [Vitis vinifera]|uniref:Serine/threonine-protein phosphatase 7 long form-like n=1 Tax=Vitis vinifera TaxID=29760 RepID=A0A438CPA5_VITVI|nr:Serine/threonine-protein phosphatase 7 long form-like [Vitis vinifera]